MHQIQTVRGRLKVYMTTKNYLTSRISNQVGLAAIAYGQSDYFAYVQDQVIGSHTYYDLHLSRPSSVFTDLHGSFSDLKTYFCGHLSLDQGFQDLLLLYPGIESAEVFFDYFIKTFLREIDNISTYGVNLPDFLQECLDLVTFELSLGGKIVDYTGFVKDFVEGLAEEITSTQRFDSIFRIVADNPLSKIYDLPDNKIIPLRTELLNEYNHKGFTKELVEIPVSDWESGYIYRNIKDFNSPKITQCVTENYSGYTLDQINNLEVTNGLGTETMADALSRVESYPTRSLVNNRLSLAEQRILEFDLVNSPTGLLNI